MDVPDAPQQIEAKVSVPVEADFLYAYSTVPGYYSWRNNTDGSWFIQCVTKVFDKNACRMDILQMLTRVNAVVSTLKSRNQVARNKRQVTCTVSMLTKDLYFFPEKVTDQNGQTQDTASSRCKVFWTSNRLEKTFVVLDLPCLKMYLAVIKGQMRLLVSETSHILSLVWFAVLFTLI